MTLRLLILSLLAGLFLVIGVVLANGVPPNHLLGVRTPFTFSSPESWRAVNAGAGVLMIAVTCIAYYVVTPLVASAGAALGALLAGIFVVALVSSAFPAVPSWVFSAVNPPEHSAAGVQARLAFAFGVQVLMGAAGLLLWRQRVPPNRYLGVRTVELRSDEGAWYGANRLAGACLFAGTGAAIAILASGLLAGWDPGILLGLSPLLLAVTAAAAWLRASFATRNEEKRP